MKEKCRKCDEWGEQISVFDENTLASISRCEKCGHEEITGFGRLHPNESYDIIINQHRS